MSKLYKNNMDLLRKLNMNLYNKIKDKKVLNTSLTSARNGQYNLLKIFYDKRINIHSGYNPKEQAEYIAEHALSEKPDIVFLFGLGLGYEFIEMLKINSNVRYFIVEPNAEIFKSALQNMDIKYLFSNNNIYFIQDDRYEHIVNFFASLIDHDKTVKIKFVALPSYQVLYKELLDVLYEYIKKLMNVFAVNFYTNMQYHRQWVQNYIANLKYLRNSCPVKKLSNVFKNVPAIVVAAGPSLAYNLPHLKKITNQAIIAAVGTGISILEKNQIRAHLAGAIDGTNLEENLFKNLVVNKNTPLFYSSNVYYKVPSLLSGSNFLMNVNKIDSFIHQKLDWEFYEIYSASSIANIMVYNLSKLGCNPIILLGQDLCFSRDKTYAEGAEEVKGSIDLKPDYRNNPNHCQAKNKNGELVYTNRPFLSMRDLMENCIKLFPDTLYLNGTKDGLPIKGTEDIDFNNYADNIFLKSPDSYHISEAITGIYQNHLKETTYEKTSIVVKSLENDNGEIMRICRDIILCIENTEIDETIKVDEVQKKEEQLNEIPLFKEIIKELIKQIEYIYKNREYLDYCKQVYAYVLDKCLIMENAFIYEVNGG